MNQKLIASSLVFLLLIGCSEQYTPSQEELEEQKKIFAKESLEEAQKQKLMQEKQIADTRIIINSTTVTNIEKLRAIEKIHAIDPVEAEALKKRVMAEVNKKVAENEKQLDQIRKQNAIDSMRLSQLEKRRKKQEGVRVGMTMQDVLDSSWGRPQHKTTYHTAIGEHTIWQYGEYGERGTISFKDGVVDMIQN